MQPHILYEHIGHGRWTTFCPLFAWKIHGTTSRNVTVNQEHIKNNKISLEQTKNGVAEKA